MNNAVLWKKKKKWEMWENIEILNLSQHKEEGMI